MGETHMVFISHGVCFGIVDDDVCLFCHEGVESRDHLFLGCNLPWVVWKKVLRLCHISLDPMGWESEFEWAIAHILRIAWSAFVYMIWEERNRRKFRRISRTAEKLSKGIQDIVRIKVQGKKIDYTDRINIILCTK
ncbi:hypothetical protein V6N13_116593 [Hibiscus sabdariffa]